MNPEIPPLFTQDQSRTQLARVIMDSSILFQTQPQPLPQTLEEDDEDFAIISSSKPKKRRKKEKECLQIDSKEDSVQEIRQQTQQLCIVLQPEPVPLGYAINLENNQENHDLATAPAIQALPSQIVEKIASVVDPKDVQNKFSQLFQDKEAVLPEILQRQKELSLAQSLAQPQPAQLSNLFPQNLTEEKTKEAFEALANQIRQTQVGDDQIMQIPKQLITLVTNNQPKKTDQNICQQLLMITMSDILNCDDIKIELHRLIRSNFKEQLCLYIQTKIKEVDAVNQYNAKLLKQIQSRWVWDNVVPFMAECIYRDGGEYRKKKIEGEEFCNVKLQIKLLPERCNKETIVILKYHIFLILSEMFFGLLPRQISTFHLPITFGEIMTEGDNDTLIDIHNKQNKLKCLLHYFSAILREKQKIIKNCQEFISFRRFRMSIKRSVLEPGDENNQRKFQNLKLTDHLELATVRHGNQYLKETAVYLTHENIGRQSGEETFQIPHLMEQTYRMIYTNPQIFILKALTPMLDLGQAIIVQGLQQFSKAVWASPEDVYRDKLRNFQTNKFICEGLFNEQPDFDREGRRKGRVILIFSRLLFSQKFTKDQKERMRNLSANYTVDFIKIEVQTLFSAFQKKDRDQQQRILISERYIKFIEEEYKWLYFMIVWIASSILRVKVVFQFQKYEDKTDAILLMKRLDGYSIHQLMEIILDYRNTIIEAYQNWIKIVEMQIANQQHEWNLPTAQMKPQNANNQASKRYNRVSTMHLLDYIKQLC